MRHYIRRMPAMAAGALLLTATTAHAQPSAADLQATLRGWFANLLVPLMKLPEPPVSVTAQGAGFHLALPLGAITGTAGGSLGEITVRTHRRDDGTWSFNNLRLPPKGEIKTANNEAWRWELPHQTVHGVVDPGLTQPSTAWLRYRDVSYQHAGGDASESHRMGEYEMRATMIPGADGRLTVLSDEIIRDWDMHVGTGPQAVTVGIARAKDTYRLEGLSRGQGTALFHAVSALVGNPTTNEAEAIQQLDAMAGMLRELIRRANFETALEEVDLRAEGASIRADRLHMALGGEAPGGKLDLWFDAALHRLDLDPIPARLKSLLPRLVSIRSAISGMPTEALAGLVDAALTGGADSDKLQAQVLALLDRDDARIGIERLEVIFDRVHVTGEGRVRKLDSGQPGFELHLTATGMDGLIAEAKKDRGLEPALPFLMIAQSLAKAEGKTMTWTVEASAAQTLVNGVDVIALAQNALEPPKKTPGRKDQKKPSSSR